MQILGVPLPGYALLYAPKLMPAVNFDIFHFLEKYWRDVSIFDYVKNEHLLGNNVVTFGFESIHFLDNTRSSLALVLTLLFIFAIFSWTLRKKNSRNYMVASILVLVKSIAYMIFITSALIQLRYNGDDGI